MVVGMISTGRSLLKSTLVWPRLKLAVPITLLLPQGLSAPDSAVEWWASKPKRSLSVTFQSALKPSDLLSFLVAKSAPPMDRSASPLAISSV